MFRLLLLGRVELVGPDGLTLGLSGKALALIAYLRFASGRKAHRAFLADLLWSEVDAERARASLRQTILVIRQVGGADFLQAEGNQIRLVDAVECDAVTFLDLANRGAFADALSIYSGAFFEEFALPGARSFELWATVERERMRAVFERVADAVAQQFLDEGRASDAAAVAERLVSADSSRERPWRLLLEARLLQGDAAAATIAAAQLRAALEIHDITLEPATTALLDRIERRQSTAVAARRSVLRADLVGRTRVFAHLLDTWKRVSGGGLRVCAVTGDAGIGKSRLLDDLSMRLRTTGGRVVKVSARQGEKAIAYSLLQQLVEALVALSGAAGISSDSARTLVAFDPALRATYQAAQPELVSAADQPLRRVSAVVDLLSAVSEDRPLALIVDDLHWVDDESVTVLAGAIARLGAARLLVLLAGRELPAAELLADVWRLDALSPSDIRDLLSSIATLPVDDWASQLPDALRRATGGSPLLVLESLELLTQERLLALENTEWTTPGALALSFRLGSLNVLVERLARLDVKLRESLLHLSLAPFALRHELLTLALAGPRGDALEHLARHGWVSLAGDSASVRHDEMRRSVLDGANAVELLAAKRAVARAITTDGARSDAEWRLAARLLLDVDDLDGLLALIESWLLTEVSERRSRGWTEAVDALLGHGVAPDIRRALLKRRPFIRRLPRWRVNAARAVAAAALLAVIAGFGLQRERTAVALHFVESPIAAMDVGLSPVPVVEIVNAGGRRVSGARDTIRLRKTPTTHALLVGNVKVVASGGLARFPDARLEPSYDDTTRITVVAEATGLTSATVKLLGVPDTRMAVASLRGESSTVAAVRADTIFVAPSVTATISINLRYTAPWMAASIMLAGIPQWGDRRTNWIELGAMATPVRDGSRFARVQFATPDRPGRYRLLFVMAPESNAEHIASGTNWAVGASRWGDGNDVALWNEPIITAAQATGHVADANWLYRGGRGPISVGVAVVNVIVRDR